MAVYHEEEIHRRVVVPVLLEPVDWSVFPPEVSVYLEEHRVIPYEHGNPDFVDRLVEIIRTEVRV